MKIISILITFLMLVGLLAGCQETTTNKEVSVANMILEIPNEWQKTDNYNEMVDNFVEPSDVLIV